MTPLNQAITDMAAALHELAQATADMGEAQAKVNAEVEGRLDKMDTAINSVLAQLVDPEPKDEPEPDPVPHDAIRAIEAMEAGEIDEAIHHLWLATSLGMGDARRTVKALLAGTSEGLEFYSAEAYNDFIGYGFVAKVEAEPEPQVVWVVTYTYVAEPGTQRIYGAYSTEPLAVKYAATVRKNKIISAVWVDGTPLTTQE